MSARLKLHEHCKFSELIIYYSSSRRSLTLPKLLVLALAFRGAERGNCLLNGK